MKCDGYYTNIAIRGKNILVRGYDSNGASFRRKEEFMPTMFVPSSKETKYKTLSGG